MEQPLSPVSTMFIATPTGHPLPFTPPLRFGATASHWPSPRYALRHPTGDPAPSSADVQVTRQLREAAKALDIELLKHTRSPGRLRRRHRRVNLLKTASEVERLRNFHGS